MPKELPTYRRLPGYGRGMVDTVRLYLAADHLLQVSSNGFVETYRRFYLRDIQAIRLRVSWRGRVWNAVWGFLLFLLAVIALQAGPPAAPIWWAMAGVFLLPLISHVARGPTCDCQIQTAVQTCALPSLNRLRRAGKIIAQLRPLIEAAQGTLPPGELVRRVDEARSGARESHQ
jgi:hypothetical protein